MPWKNCSGCGMSYNDQKGGCTNKVCKNFDRNTASGTPSHGGVAKLNMQVVPPKFSPSTPALTSVFVAPASPDRPIVPWIATPTTRPAKPPPRGVELKAESFTLICYRGEKSEWWPEPRMRLAAGGMNVFEPWPGKTMTEIWDHLVKQVKNEAGFNVKQKVAAYAQYLRASGRPFALATARTTGGAFEGNSYVIEIKEARTFLWGNDFALGPPANFKDTQKTAEVRIINQNKETWWNDTISTDYIVLNADTIAESTILGFGHKTGTYEVTFLHDLPLSFVKSVNGTAPSTLKMYTEEDLRKPPDSKDKQTALKLFRKH
jgi:hypothetical protein